MTPQEVAKQLIYAFQDDLMECDTYFLEEAQKRCALIAVNYIITSNPHSNPLNNTEVYSTMRYWQEVKTEIIKLEM